MLNFGTQLKSMRKDNSFTLQDLADRSKVSKSMISKVERGEVQPTIEVASRLAKGLSVSLSSMLTFDYLPRVEQLEPKDRVTDIDPQTKALSEMISGGDEHEELSWIKKVYPPQTTGVAWPAAEGGEKYFYVLEGEIDVIVAGERYELHTGDALFFDMTCGYQCENKTQKSAEFYVVTKHLREWKEESE